MTVSQLLNSLDSVELTEWVAFLQLERARETGQQAEPEDIAWRRAFSAF